jgi:hypothetical protein
MKDSTGITEVLLDLPLPDRRGTSGHYLGLIWPGSAVPTTAPPRARLIVDTRLGKICLTDRDCRSQARYTTLPLYRDLGEEWPWPSSTSMTSLQLLRAVRTAIDGQIGEDERQQSYRAAQRRRALVLRIPDG